MKWTEENDQFLRTYYPEFGAEWCAKNLGRKAGQIRYRAGELSIITTHRGSKPRKITPELSDSITRRISAGEHPRAISRDLMLSPAILYAELRRLGLKSNAERVRRPNLTEDEESQIVADYASGGTIEAISRAKDLSVACVQAVLSRKNIATRQGGWYRFKDPVILEDIRRRYNAGEGAATIARNYSSSSDAIISVIRRLGIILRSRSDAKIKLPAEQVAAILERYADGYTTAEVAGDHGISRATVCRIIRENGGILRSSKGASRYGFTDKIGRKFAFRSTWERALAEHLDEKSIEWDYEVEVYDLHDGSTYLPDFFIYDADNLKSIIEVRGHYDQRSRTKIAAFKKCYPSIPIEVWQKEKLRSIGIRI
jgi:Homeodomain-like domain-containing protein